MRWVRAWFGLEHPGVGATGLGFDYGLGPKDASLAFVIRSFSGSPSESFETRRDGYSPLSAAALATTAAGLVLPAEPIFCTLG